MEAPSRVPRSTGLSAGGAGTAPAPGHPPPRPPGRQPRGPIGTPAPPAPNPPRPPGTGGSAPHYRFGAVEVRCDVALPGYSGYLTDRAAPTTDGAADRHHEAALPVVTVRLATTAPATGPLLARLSTRRGPLEVRAAGDADRVVVAAGLAPYTLHADRAVSWHLSGPPSQPEADHLVSAVIPWAVATGRDTPVLHAGTLLGPGGALLLVGRSGAGKSTLSTALHRRLGWPLLGDDAAVLRLDGANAQVMSCSREVRLWDDAGALLGLDAGIPLPRYTTKSRHAIAGLADHPVPVAAVIRVDSPEPPETTATAIASADVGVDDATPTGLASLPPVDGLLLLRAGLMRTALIPVADAAREFAFLTRWMRGVAFAALSYPHRPAALDEAVDLIAAFAAAGARAPARPR